MSASLVRTVIDPAGWPVAGAVVDDGRTPARMPVLLGDMGLWSNDPAWWRAFASAAVVCANTLEAVAEGKNAVAPVEEEPLAPAPEPSGSVEEPLPAGVDPTGVSCPKGCRHLVYPGPNGLMHRVQGGTAAACPPADDQETSVFPRIQVEERV